MPLKILRAMAYLARKDETNERPASAIAAYTISAVAPPMPEARPITGPCVSILRKQIIPIGPTGKLINAPARKPLKNNK